MYSFKFIVTLYKRELQICEATDSRILAKIKLSRIFRDLQ